MAKTGGFSMLAETAEEFIQLECARRRNQASHNRRSSLPSQFHVSGHKSRLKEKLAQARRHDFLLRADNKAALIGIVDNVRELANYDDKGQHNNGPSPLERDRFKSWAADVEKLLFEFEPSENHANDPLLGVVEHLQFLQDGHVCLAEMAMDARTLLERWDRSGVFDSETSSEDDDDEENDGFPDDTVGFLAPSTAKDNIRHLEKSYAYQNIRQRAAASIIKRNVLTWVRSKASFCERVAEIEIFGRTTEALLKELSLTSAVLAGNAGTDIFALATGRPKSRYSGSIAFTDLLQFSKHMALFPVDQALRTVEDVTRRRYLFDSRCAMKIQAVWRRVGVTVRARRLRRAVEQLRLQREQEAQAKREATKEAKKRKASEAGKRKVSNKRSSTTRSSVIASEIPRLLSTATPVDEEMKEKLSALETRVATADASEKRKPLSPTMPIDVSNRTRANTSGADDRLKPPSTPRSRHKASQCHGTNNHDSDDDTTDVEAAWQSFMDTVATDLALQEPVGESEVNSALEARAPISPMPPVMLPSMDDNWESWSDEENDLSKNESQKADTGRPLTGAKPRTPSASTARTPRVKVVVSSNKSDLSEPVARRPRREISTPRQHQSRVSATPTSMIRPPSSLPFDATLQNHTGPYTGAGQLSLMAPFVDADRSKKTQAVVVPERKHLYEMDYTGAQRSDAAMVHIATALTGSAEAHVHTQPSRPKTPENFAGPTVDTPRVSSRRTTVSRLRSITGEQEQSERIRELLDPENRDTKDQQGISTRVGNNLSKPGYFIYESQGKTANIRREVVMRKGTMDYSPLAGPPDEEPPKSVEPGVNEVKTWHRSTIAAIPQGLIAPHPPTDRFHLRNKNRQMGPQRKTISTEIMDQIEAIENLTSKTSKRVEKNNELPLLLRRSRAAARRREAERLDVLPGEEDPEIPAPDATKQMWKRGGELPELALAQIRDRVGYKRMSSGNRRMSIIAGRAPPIAGGQREEKSLATTDLIVDHPETIFPLDEEAEEDNEEDTTSEDDEEVDHPEESDTKEDDLDADVNRQNNSNDSDDLCRRKKSDKLSEEFRQLHLASRQRELTGQQSLLSQLQNEEDMATNDVRRRSKDDSSHDQKSSWRRQSEVVPGAEDDETSSVTGSNDYEESALLYYSSDEDSDTLRRRHLQLRVKTRDATGDLLDDEEGEEEEEEEEVSDQAEIGGMTQQERDAAFQKLLTQYLGLLQCTPAEVARRLQVNI